MINKTISYSDISHYKNCSYSFFLKKKKNEVRKFSENVEEHRILNSLISSYLGKEFSSSGRILEYDGYKVNINNMNHLSTKDIQKVITTFKDDIEQQSSLQDIKKEILKSSEHKFSALFFNNDLKYKDIIDLYVRNDEKKYIILLQYKYGSITSYDFEQLDYLSTVLFKENPTIETIYEYIYYPKENSFNRKKILSNEIEPIYQSINLQTSVLSEIIDFKNDSFSRSFTNCGTCSFKYACGKLQQMEEQETLLERKILVGDITSSFGIVQALYDEQMFSKYVKMYNNNLCQQVIFLANDRTDFSKKSLKNYFRKFFIHSDLEKIVVYDIDTIKFLFDDIEDILKLSSDELDKEVFKLKILEDKELYVMYLNDMNEDNSEIIEQFKHFKE